MHRKINVKTALLAAVSLSAATFATSHASEAIGHVPAPMVMAADPDSGQAPQAAGQSAVRLVGFAALGSAAVALMMRALGRERVAALVRAMTPAAKAIAAAPAAAARALGRAASAPLRFAATFAGFAAIGFVGLSLYDLEWAGGVLVGGALVALVWAGAAGFSRLVAARAKSTR